jgi:heme exporter protein A
MAAPELRLEQARHVQDGALRLGPVTLRLGPGIWELPPDAARGRFLRMIAGDLAPTAGRVLWNGLSMYRKEAALREVSLFRGNPAQPDFFTVEEAWKLAATLRGKEKWEGEALQAAFGLPQRSRLGGLSELDRRKAELLAALAGDPSLLVLDDIYSWIDEAAGAALSACLEARRQQRILVIAGPVPLRADGALAVPSWGEGRPR